MYFFYMGNRNNFPHKVSTSIAQNLWLFFQDVLQGIFCISKCLGINGKVYIFSLFSFIEFFMKNYPISSTTKVAISQINRILKIQRFDKFSHIFFLLVLFKFTRSFADNYVTLLFQSLFFQMSIFPSLFH